MFNRLTSDMKVCNNINSTNPGYQLTNIMTCAIYKNPSKQKQIKNTIFYLLGYTLSKYQSNLKKNSI